MAKGHFVFCKHDRNQRIDHSYVSLCNQVAWLQIASGGLTLNRIRFGLTTVHWIHSRGCSSLMNLNVLWPLPRIKKSSVKNRQMRAVVCASCLCQMLESGLGTACPKIAPMTPIHNATFNDEPSILPWWVTDDRLILAQWTILFFRALADNQHGRS